MPDGDFPGRADSLLLELASQQATGCLTLSDPDGEQATVWFRDGLVYAVSVPGRRPLLGVRLMSSGALTPEGLAEALEVQRTELQGWRLGELLVHLGFVDRAVVEAFVTEQVRDQVADLLHWNIAARKFRNGKRTRQDVAPPIEVTDLLDLARQRDARWAEIVPFILGADGVPVLSTSSDAAPDVVLGPYDWALLCKVDGARTIADLADDCGFTVFEAGMVVVGLLDAGLVEIDNAVEDVDEQWAGDWTEDQPTDDEVAVSVAKVTAALNDMNRAEPSAASRAARPLASERAPLTKASSAPEPAPRRSPFTSKPVVEEPLAAVVSLASEREARDEAERTENERIEAERLAREEREREAAEQAEAERIEAERLEAERLENERIEREAAEQAERIENERIEREAAEQAEAERIENERLEAERIENERIAAEQAEAERLENERIEREAAEQAEAERIENERIAAEVAEAERIENERIEREAAEQAEADRIENERLEAERIENERIAAELAEAERIENERIAAELAEAQRIEDERIEAERLSREEQERFEEATRQADRIAREAAERVEAERAEASRIEALRIEAARLERVERELEQAELQALGMEYPVPGIESPIAIDRHTVNAVFTDLAMDPPQPTEVIEVADDVVDLDLDLDLDLGMDLGMDLDVDEDEDDEAVTAPTYSLDDDDALDAEIDAEPPVAAEPVHVTPRREDLVYGEPRIVEPELEPAMAGGSGHAEGADMAALLRELSSLGGGFDSDPTPGSAVGNAAAVGRPVHTGANEKGAKKKKGFFGR